MKGLRRRAATLGLAALLLAPAGCATLLGPDQNGTTDPAPPPQLPNREDLPPEQALPLKKVVAETLEKAGKVPDAIAAYQEVERLDPNYLRAARRLSILYDRAGAFDKAEAEYRKLAPHQAHNPDFFCDWGWSYHLRGQFDEADKQLRHALELKPDHTHARCNLAVNEACQGQYREAYEDLLKGQCTEAQAHSLLAGVFLQQDRKDDAREACLRALKADPSCEGAKVLLMQLDTPAAPGKDRRNARRPAAPPPDQPPPAPEGVLGPQYGRPVVSAPPSEAMPKPVLRTPGTMWMPVTPASRPPAAPQAPATPVAPTEELFR